MSQTHQVPSLAVEDAFLRTDNKGADAEVRSLRSTVVVAEEAVDTPAVDT